MSYCLLGNNIKLLTPSTDSRSIAKGKCSSFLTLTSSEREINESKRETESFYPVVVKGLLTASKEETIIPTQVQQILTEF